MTAADSNHYDWQGVVLTDSVVDSTRWLFCYGEGGSGQGLIALTSEDSEHWLLTSLGFGLVSHAGDSPVGSILDARRASITYGSWIREEHDHAFTTDAGQTWLVIEFHPE